MAAKKEKTIIGFYEKAVVIGEKKKVRVVARIDTGATMSSIDSKTAAELNLGPVIKTKLVKQAQGSVMRPVIKASVKFAGRQIKASFTIADRAHLKYRVLIGQNILKMGFLIDPNKK